MDEGKEIRFIDQFSGIGGFRLGLERAGGFRNVWSCDNNKYANRIYTRQFGEAHHHTGDIRGVDPGEIPDFDLLCAGFPCQAFSSAGKREGFQDIRGTLFFEICRIAEVKKPSLLLLENVKGLLNHDGGRTFTIVLQTLDELGYWIEWQVLNSKHHGVPQNRERVFIIGHLRGSGGREIFPISYDGPTTTETNEEKHGQITNTITGGNASGFNARGNYILAPKVAGALTGGGHSGGLHSDMTVILDDGAFRRLTPIECERLQGFPDDWTEGVSNTQRYKCLGNAVTVNVIEFLGQRINGLGGSSNVY